MSDVRIDLANNPNALRIGIEWMQQPFERMIENVGPVNKKALNTAAYIIKDKVQQTFENKMPAAGRSFKVPATSKGGYKITKPDRLIDAVRQSSATTLVTHVFMGGRDPGSPLFISRIYDKGSKDRYQRTYKGVKLAKRRYLGKVGGVHYWEPGIAAGQSEAINAVERIFNNYTKKCMNES